MPFAVAELLVPHVIAEKLQKSRKFKLGSASAVWYDSDARVFFLN